MKTVFLDVDGCIADSISWWVQLYNRDHKTSYTINDVTEYNVNALGMPLSVYYHDYRMVKPVDGALEAIEELRKHYRVAFATAGFGKTWLQDHVKFSEEDFIQIKDKSLLRGYALVDDYDRNLHGFVGRRLMVGQPWNRRSAVYVGLTWKEITEVLIHEAVDVTTGVQWTPSESELRPAMDA